MRAEKKSKFLLGLFEEKTEKFLISGGIVGRKQPAWAVRQRRDEGIPCPGKGSNGYYCRPFGEKIQPF